MFSSHGLNGDVENTMMIATVCILIVLCSCILILAFLYGIKEPVILEQISSDLNSALSAERTSLLHDNISECSMSTDQLDNHSIGDTSVEQTPLPYNGPVRSDRLKSLAADNCLSEGEQRARERLRSIVSDRQQVISKRKPNNHMRAICAKHTNRMRKHLCNCFKGSPMAN